jgi:hypothetical protein
MWLGDMAIDVHVTRGRGDGEDGPGHVLAQNDLAAEARGGRKAEGKVEHVILFVTWFRKRLVEAIFEDDMTCRTGKRTFTGSFQIHLVRMGNSKHVHAHGSLHCLLFSIFLIDKRYRDFGGIFMAMRMGVFMTPGQ